MDAILQKTLKSNERPDDTLLQNLKYGYEKGYTVKNKKIMRPFMVIVAALIAALSVSAVVFAAAPIVWQYLDTRILQGEEFVEEFSIRVSEDGKYSVMVTVIDAENIEGALIVEVDGEPMVMFDKLQVDNMEEALELLAIYNVLMPSYLPEGFVFEQVTFPINPIIHPDALSHMLVDFSNGDENIRLQISQHDYQWGMSIFSSNQVDILINGNIGAIADNMVAVIIEDVLYLIDGSSLTQEELIMIAESLQ